MTAPGDNLEFQGSSVFKARVIDIPGFEERVAKRLKNTPDAGTPVCSGINELELEVLGIIYVVFVARHRNRISLMYVYQLSEPDLIEKRRKQLIRLYGKGGVR